MNVIFLAIVFMCCTTTTSFFISRRVLIGRSRKIGLKRRASAVGHLPACLPPTQRRAADMKLCTAEPHLSHCVVCRRRIS